MCEKEVLKVQMLGGFSITYGDSLITFKKNTASKSMQLLQLLLYKKETGVPRKELIEILYGRGGLSDPSNNLRVSVHRLRRQMAEAGLPEEEYIKIVNGVYTWSSSVPTIIDVLEFHSLTEKAKDEKNPEKKAELQKKALELYQGDFLPKLSGEDWVLLEAVKYKNEYEETLQEVLEYQERCENFEEILRLSAAASDLYPFDEWQRYKIEALMGMGRDEEAMQVYQDTSRLFFEELGIQPSERMIHQFREMSKRIRNVPKAMPDIKGGLQEKGEETGAYYCSLPSFIDGYRLIRRMIERNGQSVYLMLCTLTDGNGNPMESGSKLERMSGELKLAIKRSLRKGDSYTQYSVNQFLILLIGTNEENCSLVSDRITRNFAEEHKYWKNCIEYYVSSVIDVECGASKVSFRA